MVSQFTSFVILAGMRTGSNFLEDTLNQIEGVSSYGEVFNPVFVGKANQNEMFGISIEERERDPLELIARMKSETTGLPGFRLFHDHDERVLQNCLKDRTCAKIVLYRNPVESYVSHEIARKTNQWRLGDVRNAKTAQAEFSPTEFSKHIDQRQNFHSATQRALQIAGQSAYYIGYEDISDGEVINGLCQFLGLEAQEKKLKSRTKKQNPESLESKVSNYSEMAAALAKIDQFALENSPVFEPQRGPAVPSFVAAPNAPILYMPIESGPNTSILEWLRQVGEGEISDLVEGFTQKSLRQWKRKSTGHQSFSVVTHPVLRLHRSFVGRILSSEPSGYSKVREILAKRYGFSTLLKRDANSFSSDQHRALFLKFARFAKSNLAGQTSVRVDKAWATQDRILAGMGQILIPSNVFRESELGVGLDFVANSVGVRAPQLPTEPNYSEISLDQIYDEEVEAAVRAAYQRDYMMFGFGAWKP